MIMTQAGVVDDESRFTLTPKRIHEPVEVGRGTWIGAGAVLVGGTRLGDGCTVSPNSVVSGEYAAGTTLVGNPARVARQHNVD
jgi:acetyltransferase-like isoleucine patch superfamily enzyme